MIEFPEYRDPRTLLLSINMIAEQEVFTVLDTETAASALKGGSTSASKQERDWIMIAVAACHRRMRAGHSHIDLHHPEPELLNLLEYWPEPAFWSNAFSRLDFADTRLPIMWEPPGFLYIRKLWNHETTVADKLIKRTKLHAAGRSRGLHQALLDGCSERQQQAIQAIANESVILLSGGPGTGKTFTVLRCLAALLTIQPEARVALLAPTGKAVARLNASINQGMGELDIPEDIKARIPTTARTIHRFLNEVENESKGSFMPYPPPVFDWIFVDEVSMVDLRLMTRLLSAIPDACRLFMLGDVHQLASVEPGSVFSDIYQTIENTQPASIGFQTIELNETFRFTSESPIYRLCEAVKSGDLLAARKLLSASASATGISSSSPTDPNTNTLLNTWIADHLLEPLLQPEPEEALKQFRKALLLCATNRGPFGVETLNARIRRRLEIECRKRGLSHFWSPVLITQNDYRNDLFNGDIGLQKRLIHDVDDAGQVFFERSSGLYPVNRTQLPAHTDAFALTVHKSQGSEADEVMILLPEADSPVLTRELLYTAISRAKNRLHLIASPESIERAIQHRTERNSRLGHRLRERFER